MFYVCASILAAVIIILPFTIIAMAMNRCTLFRLVDFPYNMLIFWLMIGLWEVVGVIYCSVTIIKVVIKLTRFHDDIGIDGTTSPTVDRISNSIQNRVEQVVRRLVFYPLIPVLTQTPYIIFANLSLINDGQKSLIERYIYYVPSYSAGFLNAIVFLFDPALPEIRRHFTHFLIRKYYQQPKLKSDFEQPTFFTRLMSNWVYKFLIATKYPNDTGSRLSKISQQYYTNFLVPCDLNGTPVLDSPAPPSKSLSRRSSQTCSSQLTTQKYPGLRSLTPSPFHTPSDEIQFELESTIDQSESIPTTCQTNNNPSSRISIYSTTSTRDLSEQQLTLLL